MFDIRALVWPVDDDTMKPWVRRFLDDVLSRPLFSRMILFSSMENRLDIRNRFARKYLVGRGIELGAQQVPTKTAENCQVEYVDVVSNKTLVELHHLPAEDLVPLTHVIDGNDLSVYADGELDFIIANHVLEHFDDPVGGLCEWIRTVKNGGKLFITLPNFRCNCYDVDRVPTRRDHLDLDYRDSEGRAARNFQHYVEIMQTLFQLSDPVEQRRQAQEWIDADLRQHYHVYDEETVKDVAALAAKASSVGLRYVDGLLSKDGFEFLFILEKQPSGGLQGWPSSMRSTISALLCHAPFLKREIMRRQ
ncbi:methyltransferase domain-containing protein [Agrobacterium vitis]